MGKPAKLIRADRRQFLASATATSASAFLLSRGWANEATETEESNPYQAVNWDAVTHVGSGSHIHCRSQRALSFLHRRGLRHLAISNYYPSVPCSSSELIHQYRVSQGFATIDGRGYTKGEFRWNDLIRDPETGWFDDLPEELQKTLPFKIGPPIFTHIPDDVIICPNAEHHSLKDSNGHFNAPGSHFASGTFDVRGKYKLHEHGYPIGVGLPWREFFERVFDALQFADGGGITINHPVWSGLAHDQILEMLDFDPRVLGIEIWNQTCEQLNGKGWAISEWDGVLRTGRRCFGFAVSDHAHSNDPDFRGYNVLLVDSGTPADQYPEACLRAYRRGQFYCTLSGESQFRKIHLENGRLNVATSVSCNIKLITAAGVVQEHRGSTLEWSVPAGRSQPAVHRYVRVEAVPVEGDDHLLSQPLLLV